MVVRAGWRHASILVLCASTLTVQAATRQQPQALTPAAALETTRIANNANVYAYTGNAAQMPVSLSPDGTRYVARLVRGDVQKNGAWMELIAGGTGSLDAAARHQSVTRLFTTGLGSDTHGIFGPESDTSDASLIRWLDNERVSFLWSDPQQIRQVVLVNLRTHEVRYLTQHPTQVRSYAIAPDESVVYTAEATHSADASKQRMREGFVLDGSIDALALLMGDADGHNSFDRFWNSQWFIAGPGRGAPRPIRIAGREDDLTFLHPINISPDGRRALLATTPESYPDEWDRYSGYGPLLKASLAEARRDPHKSSARIARQWFVLDLQTGASRALWSAVASLGAAAVWSPDSSSALLTATYLPIQNATTENEDQRGLTGKAVAIVDVATGKFVQLPIEVPDRGVASAAWSKPDTLQMDVFDQSAAVLRRHVFGRSGGEWKLVSSGPVAADNAPARVRMEVRQDLNTPPKLHAVDTKTGASRMILDPNPDLTSRYTLGRVERIEGKLQSGEAWSALVYYPVRYSKERRYPLVLQSEYTTPYTERNFTLYGFRAAGLGPTLISPYPGQALANRDIAVAHVVARPKISTVDEAPGMAAVYEAVIDRLTQSGLADRARVGIVGFSRNGFYVEYALSHSKFPYAAAISVDNWDPSYTSAALANWDVQTFQVNGGPPFGDTLKKWLETTPGFNAESIRTPLRKVGISAALLNPILGWELYSRLVYLHKPVEYYLVPDLERGTHNTQNPGQILAVQRSTIDWFDFWLNGREDSAREKTQQYERWHRLRELHEADLQSKAAAQPAQ